MSGEPGTVRVEWNVCIEGQRLSEQTLVTEIDKRFLPASMEKEDLENFMRERMHDHFTVAVSFVPTKQTIEWWTEVYWDTPTGE